MTKISAVVPDDVAAALKARAKAEDRSVGAVIRLALADLVRRPAATDDVPASVPSATDGKDDDGR